ncbi:hypothetical protein AB4305_16580 [Nocardia sp. 2YAB30]|uniref:hypothetical protein n=1 Tax=unclassified Nocardia TaxID=2637762 RepID=UPI003F94C41F
MAEDRVKVETDKLRDLSGDLKDIAGKIRAVMDDLKSETEPLMAQPVCGSHEPGENFRKDYDSQCDAIHSVGSSYVKILEGDFATAFDKSAKLLDEMEEKSRAEINKAMRGYRA